MNKKIIGTTTVVPFYAGVAQLVEQLIRNELVAAKKSVGCTSDVEISIN